MDSVRSVVASAVLREWKLLQTNESLVILISEGIYIAIYTREANQLGLRRDSAGVISDDAAWF